MQIFNNVIYLFNNNVIIYYLHGAYHYIRPHNKILRGMAQFVGLQDSASPFSHTCAKLCYSSAEQGRRKKEMDEGQEWEQGKEKFHF